MAGSRSRDTAILIGKAAQFAAGFGTTKGDPTGVATAGTAQQFGKPTLGQQVRGGFSAISPAFRSFEESRAGVERSSAETNLALEKARQLRLEENKKKALALKPFDISKPFGVKATSEMTKATDAFFRRNGVDLDNNGITTNEEVTKFLSSGSASERTSKKKELARIASLGTKNMQRQSQFVQVKIDEEMKKLKEKFQDSSLTINDVINNPAMASGNKKLIGFLDELESNTKRSDAFTQFQVGIQRDIDEGDDKGRDFKITTDELGNLVAIDKETLERVPVPREGRQLPNLRDAPSPEEEVGGAREPFITARELGKATGAISGTATFLARAFGILIPGEQFSSIQSARNKVRNLNKQIVQTLVLSKRFPVFEQAQIQGFLIDPSSFFADPGSASGKTLDFKGFILRKKQGLENQLNQTISAEQRKTITGKLGNIDQVLAFLPNDLELKVASGREITIDDVKGFPKSRLEFLPKEVKQEMFRLLNAEQGVTSGGF